MGRGRKVRVAAAVAGALVVLGAAGGGAGAQEEAGLAFAESNVGLAPGGGTVLTLYNNTAQTRPISLRAGGGLTLSREQVTIGPGGDAQVELSADGIEDDTETHVVAVAAPVAPAGPGAEGVVARLQVSVTARGPAAAEPLVTEWAVTSYRFKPWGDAVDNPVLPLRGATSCASLSESAGTVGGVAGRPGAARVEAECTDAGAPGADAGLALAFPGLARHTGEYAGEIDLAPGEEGGIVRLTVRRTDYVLLPLLVLALGVGAAVAVRRRAGRVDAETATEHDALLLLTRVDDAHRAFRAQARNAAWATYTFKADADARLRRVLRRSGPAAGAALAPGIGAPDLAPVVTAATAWPLLADRLSDLDATVAEVAIKAPAHRPPTEASNEPACLAPARTLLRGRPVTVNQAVELAVAVEGAARLTQGWLEWAGTVADLDSRLELAALEMDDLGTDDPRAGRLAEARARLGAARTGLWQASGLADLEDRGVLRALAEARALVDGLGRSAAAVTAGAGTAGAGTAGEAAGAAAAGAGAAGGPGAAGAAVADTNGAEVDVVEDIEPVAPVPAASPLGAALDRADRTGVGLRRRAEAWRRGRRLVAPGLAAVVVVWSGLSVLYAGRAFGTPVDYLGVLVWGFAGQLVLGQVVELLDRLADPARGVSPAGR